MAVVVMPEMAEFVKKDIVPKRVRQTDYVQIEIDVPSGRAASPVGGIVLDRHFVIGESISGCKFRQPQGKFRLGLTSQSLDLIRRSDRSIFHAILLTAQSLKNPSAFQFEKGHCGSIRYHIRNRHAHTLDRMHADGDTTAAGALSEDHLPYLRVRYDLFRSHLSVTYPFEEIEKKIGEFR